MKMSAGWLAGVALLAILGAGCEHLGCKATPGGDPAVNESAARNEAAAQAVLARALELYRGEGLYVSSIKDYDTVIATLRAGVQDYPQTTVAPKLQLLLADMELEKIKKLNHYDLTVMERVSPAAAVAQAQGNPDPAGSTFSQGLQRAKPYTAALAAYEQVFNQWPQSEEAPQALYKLADLYAATFNPQRDPARALFYYQKLVNEYPRGANADWALFSLANTYREMGDVQRTVAAYRQLQASYPQFPPALIMMGQKYIDDHDSQP